MHGPADGAERPIVITGDEHAPTADPEPGSANDTQAARGEPGGTGNFGWKARIKLAVALSFMVLIGVQIAGRLGPATKPNAAPTLAIKGAPNEDPKSQSEPGAVEQTALVTDQEPTPAGAKKPPDGGTALMDLTSTDSRSSRRSDTVNTPPATAANDAATLSEPAPGVSSPLAEPGGAAPPLIGSALGANAPTLETLPTSDLDPPLDRDPRPPPATQVQTPPVSAAEIPQPSPRIAGEMPPRVSPRDLTLVAPPETALSPEPRPEPPRRTRPPAPSAPTDLVGGRIQPITHVVRRGENFWTIARHYYGSGRYYRALWKANEQRVPKIDELYVGTPIVVPAPENLDRAFIENPGPSARRDARATSDALAQDDGDRDDSVIRTSGAADGLLEESGRARTYTTRAGDTLRSIAARELGDARRDEELDALNRDLIDDPFNIPPGTLLRMPAQTGRD